MRNVWPEPWDQMYRSAYVGCSFRCVPKSVPEASMNTSELNNWCPPATRSEMPSTMPSFAFLQASRTAARSPPDALTTTDCCMYSMIAGTCAGGE